MARERALKRAVIPVFFIILPVLFPLAVSMTGTNFVDFYFLFPMLCGVLAWPTIGRLTRRSVIPWHLAWALTFAVVAVIHLVAGSVDPSIRHPYHDHVIAAVFGLASVASLVGGVRHRRWRERIQRDGLPVEPVVEVREDREARAYCLRCFDTLGAPEAGARICAACGFRNEAVDRRNYWNLNPSILNVERLLKVLVVLGVAVILPLVALGLGHTSPRAGWAIAMSVAAGVVVWQTVSKLTHHLYAFRASWVWAMFFGASAVIWPFITVHPDNQTAYDVGLVTVIVMFPVSLLSACFFKRWKRSLIER